ncbi:hypothetical protein B0H34DRAFT_81394 [Crassisporium funariophilum]|nr:hypothetical protein B0H34DRAFT_81394 [Crassisporium funariophilum]
MGRRGHVDITPLSLLKLRLPNPRSRNHTAQVRPFYATRTVKAVSRIVERRFLTKGVIYVSSDAVSSSIHSQVTSHEAQEDVCSADGRNATREIVEAMKCIESGRTRRSLATKPACAGAYSPALSLRCVCSESPRPVKFWGACCLYSRSIRSCDS